MPISVKESIKKTFADADLSKGILGFLLNDFYKINPEAFPYRGIRSILKALEWPADYEYTGDNPRALERAWTSNIQGVTNDGTNWYFTQEKFLWKFPTGLLGDHHGDYGGYALSIPTELFPLGYNHFGDLDYWVDPHYGGFLFVPFECWGASPPLDGRIALYKTSSSGWKPTYIGSTTLTRPPKIAPNTAWCAVNPLNGLLYTSDGDTVNFLYVYKINLIPNAVMTDIVGLELKYVGNFKLGVSISAISGGVFSKNGHLYLVSDKGFSGVPENDHAHDNDEVKNSGIFAFDMITGRLMKRMVVEYIPEGIDSEELEGITLWDMTTGQIHLIMCDNDAEQADDLYFKHWRVSDGDKDKI